jgi:hypothetical protein
VRRQLIELGALLDIEGSDRVSVDDNHDLLALGGTRQDQSRAEQHGR